MLLRSSARSLHLVASAPFRSSCFSSPARSGSQAGRWDGTCHRPTDLAVPERQCSCTALLRDSTGRVPRNRAVLQRDHCVLGRLSMRTRHLMGHGGCCWVRCCVVGWQQHPQRRLLMRRRRFQVQYPHPSHLTVDGCKHCRLLCCCFLTWLGRPHQRRFGCHCPMSLMASSGLMRWCPNPCSRCCLPPSLSRSRRTPL